MLNFTMLVAICGAILFFRAARYERMSPWLWAIASFGLSLIVSFLLTNIIWVILVQIALFGGMWAYNAQRPTRN